MRGQPVLLATAVRSYCSNCTSKAGATGVGAAAACMPHCKCSASAHARAVQGGVQICSVWSLAAWCLSSCSPGCAYGQSLQLCGSADQTAITRTQLQIKTTWSLFASNVKEAPERHLNGFMVILRCLLRAQLGKCGCGAQISCSTHSQMHQPTAMHYSCCVSYTIAPTRSIIQPTAM